MIQRQQQPPQDADRLLLQEPDNMHVIAHFATTEMEILIVRTSAASVFADILAASAGVTQQFKVHLEEFETAEQFMESVIASCRSGLRQRAMYEREIMRNRKGCAYVTRN